MNPWNLSEVNYAHVKETPYEVAVLPVGATEPHNLHLPYATDTIQVQAIGERACALAWERGARVALLPALPYGVNENTLEFPMTISVRPTTLLAVISDVVGSLEHHGVRKIVLLNGHGGNELKPHLRELFQQTPAHLFLVDWWTVAPRVEFFEAGGEHADEMETSDLLALRPDLVDLALADDGAVRASRLAAVNEGWAWLARPWHLLTTNSGYGDPARATAEKVERWLAAVSERIAGFLVELAQAEADEAFPY
jgi:creatinine amidohydrolase